MLQFYVWYIAVRHLLYHSYSQSKTVRFLSHPVACDYARSYSRYVVVITAAVCPFVLRQTIELFV